MPPETTGETPEERTTGSEARPTDSSDDADDARGRRVFQHPQWMLGVVLIFALLSLVAALDDPVWLLIGSPFVLALLVYVFVWLRRGGLLA